MKTTDLFKNNRAAKKINESLAKTFGRKLNLESFDLPQLEDARNKLRTQIHTARTASGFNENLENEAFTEAQWMLDAINSEIAEREEFVADVPTEGFDPEVFEGEVEWEFTGDDGEPGYGTITYQAKMVNGNPVVIPQSLQGYCRGNGNNRLNDDWCTEMVQPGGFQHEYALEAAQEDAEEQHNTSDQTAEPDHDFDQEYNDESIGSDHVNKDEKRKRMGAKELSTLDKLKIMPSQLKAFAKGGSEDDLLHFNKMKARKNEAYDEPEAPDADAIARRKRLQAIKDRREDERASGEKSSSHSRTVAGRAYGGAAQKDDNVDEAQVDELANPKAVKLMTLFLKGEIESLEYTADEPDADPEDIRYTVDVPTMKEHLQKLSSSRATEKDLVNALFDYETEFREQIEESLQSNNPKLYNYINKLSEKFGFGPVHQQESKDEPVDDELEEGIVDTIRSMNYKRLADRSFNKAMAAQDATMKYGLADRRRGPHEKEFNKQMDKMRQRTTKAKSLGVDEVAPPGAKAERMVKHIKKGYAQDGKLTDKERSIAYATAWKKRNKNESIQGDNMATLREGEIQQAQSIVTAKTMVDRVGRWIEELSGMENDTLLQLGDQIRDEQGQEAAKGFISSVAPAIQQALENLKGTREALATGVRTLTGEEQGAEMLGGEPEAEMPADDFGGEAEPDAMNAEVPADDFAAAEPAVGGMGDAGRMKRESVNFGNSLLKVLAG